MGAKMSTSDWGNPGWMKLQGSGRLRRSDRNPWRMYAFIQYAGAQVPRMTLESPGLPCHLGVSAILTSQEP